MALRSGLAAALACRAVLALAFLLAVRCDAQTACVGDCDGSGAVTVDELITAVNIALGSLTVDACRAFDSGGDGTITVDELLQGVNAALTGCDQRRPVANAGPNQIVLAGDRVELDGSAAVDRGGTLIAFAWSFFSLPSGSRAALSDPAVARPSFTADVPGTYILQLVVNDMTADSVPDAVLITAGVIDLPGLPGDPANAHIPEIDLPDPLPEDLVAPSGIRISTRDLIVIVRETATVAEVNTLVHSLPAVIVGGVPAAHLQQLRLMGTSDLRRILNAQHALLANPLVIATSINTGRVPKQLPPHNIQDNGRTKLWTWEVPLSGTSGNWGLKAIRMPQAWNLVDHATRKNATIDAAVLESEEAPGAVVASILHPDLAPRITPTFPALPSNHATMVAGIIGATWDNNAGIEGVHPRNITIISGPACFTGALLGNMINSLVSNPNVRVINWSAGLDFEPVDPVTGRVMQIDPLTALVDPTQPQGPGNPLWRDEVNNDGNTLLFTIQGFELLTGRSNFLMFCAGSNDRVRPGTNFDFEIRDGSECSNVAVRGADPIQSASLPRSGVGADHFFDIEPMDSRGNRSGGGSWGQGYGASARSPGSLSAPGTCVRSTEFNDGTSYDETACPGSDTGNQNYGTNDGSSFATPYVTGLAAYLWSLDPELTYQDLRKVMTDPANTVPVGVGSGGGTAAGAPRVDAFAAAMGIDIIRLNTALQLALVDVDDGTLDGNKRTRRADDGIETGLYAIIDTADGRRGDTFVTMRDFRAFRDAMTQALLEEGVLAAADTDLDGGRTHFKKDLNFDGCVGKERASPPHPATGTVPQIPVPPQGCAKAPKENVYPRYDFNGDGVIEDYLSESFKGRSLLDFGVLQELWPNLDVDANEGWNDSALLDLLPNRLGSGGSGDMEFRTNLPLGGSNTYDGIRIRIEGLNMGDGTPMVRTLTATFPRLVWTVPRDLGAISVKPEGYKNNAKVANLCLNHPLPDRALLHGEDIVVTVVTCTPTGNGTFSVSSYAYAYIHEQLAGGDGESYREQPIGGWPPGDGLLGVSTTGSSASVTDAGLPSACPVHASASAGGRASLGVLSGSATAQADADFSAPSGSVTGLCPKDTNNLERSARADAWTSSRWKDTLTIVDPSGTAGTPVDLAMGVSGPGNAADGSFFAYRVNPTTGLILNRLAEIDAGSEPTATIHTFVGDTIEIVGTLTVRVAAVTGSASNPSMTSSASVAAQFHLVPLTAGASYTSASGQTYFSSLVFPAIAPASSE